MCNMTPCLDTAYTGYPPTQDSHCPTYLHIIMSKVYAL